MPDLIWVVGIDYGYDGKTAPMTWCATEEEARKAAAILERGYVTAFVASVPRFPDCRED